MCPTKSRLLPKLEAQDRKRVSEVKAVRENVLCPKKASELIQHWPVVRSWMTNHPPPFSSSYRSWIVLAVASLILISSPSHSQSYITDADGREGGGGGWQILTELNFSSQIRLHPYVLLMVTLPCNSLSSLTFNLITFEV